MFAYLNHHKQLKFYKNFEFEAEGAEGEALGRAIHCQLISTTGRWF